VSTVQDLAHLLRELRRRQSRQQADSPLTYRELAARTGWSHGIIGEYFAGNVLPPTDRFDTLVRLLGATPAEQGALATARDRVEEHRRRTASSLDAVGGGAVPRQLPTDVPAFIGRAAALAELDQLLDVGDQQRAVTIAVLAGTAGVGKPVSRL
jgi:transcriptional regulator with XRE-family HTH domain